PVHHTGTMQRPNFGGMPPAHAAPQVPDIAQHSAIPYSAIPYSAIPNSASPYIPAPHAASEYLQSRGALPTYRDQPASAPDQGYGYPGSWGDMPQSQSRVRRLEFRSGPRARFER